MTRWDDATPACRHQSGMMAGFGSEYVASFESEWVAGFVGIRTFDRLLETIREKPACRRMVNLLALAHERGCEADLATILAADLAAGRLPDMAALRERFAPDHTALPEVVVHLTPLIAYDTLLSSDVGDVA